MRWIMMLLVLIVFISGCVNDNTDKYNDIEEWEKQWIEGTRSGCEGGCYKMWRLISGDNATLSNSLISLYENCTYTCWDEYNDRMER